MRLEADATRCLNCDTELYGPFCHHCSQENRPPSLSFSRWLMEYLGESFAFDGRLFHTVKWMLRPGKLTKEYLDGKRARQVPPLRLYLFMSAMFFLSSYFLGTKILTINSDDAKASSAEWKQELKKLDQEALDAEPAEQPPETPGDGSIHNRAAALEQKADKVLEHPEEIQRFMQAYFPKLIFLFIPFFALLLKLLYIRQQVFYLSHLIFSFHYHCFVFGMFILLSLTEYFFGQWSAFLLFTIPIYLWLAMKNIYGQGFLLTTLKCGFQIMIYLGFVIGSLVGLALGFIFTH